MSDFTVSGWCPTAWRPMMAGDGLLVRVRLRLGRITRDQAIGLCGAAREFGNGLIDITSRANVQIRGVGEDGWPVMLERLVALNLVDADPAMEARRAIMIAPDWQEGDDSQHIATMLTQRLGDLPVLPAKVGFAIDAGVAPMLAMDPADFRIERGEGGALILRADGRATGCRIAKDEAADGLVALAHWFVDSGGLAAGRMARHHAALPGWACGNERPAPARAALQPGRHSTGDAYGVPFGSMTADALAALIDGSGAQAIRITPWRILLLEGAGPGNLDGFVHVADHPAMRADACPGAPACPQAMVQTRTLAVRLAPHVEGRLHVSGCAKGCAHAGPADITLTGRDGLFDLSFNSRAGDVPARSGLGPDQLLAHFGAD
ncbi:MAG TPA: cobalamin biosynthesis protein CobG [Sphingobium sp.]